MVKKMTGFYLFDAVFSSFEAGNRRKHIFWPVKKYGLKGMGQNMVIILKLQTGLANGKNNNT